VRTPSNRDDFETLVVKLAADGWSYELSEQQSGALPTARWSCRDAITREGAVPPASEHIPALTLCVTDSTRSSSNGALPSEALPGAACRAYRAADRGADGCILENLIVFQVCFQVIKRTLR